MACECRICERHKKFKAWLQTIPEASRPFAEELMCELDHAEDDADYLRAIVDGSWPSADEIITNKRKRRSEGDRLRKEAQSHQNSQKPDAVGAGRA